MRVVVFGASGRTGRHLVRQALEGGHEVTAFVRDPARLGMDHPRLRIVSGDVMDAARVEEAVAGSEAVLSALGHTKASTKDIQTAGTENIVAAMKKHGVRRILSLTGAGVRDPKDQPKLSDKIIVFLLERLQGDVLRDAVVHAEVIKESGLDWIIVRGPMLTDGPHTGAYRVGYVGKNSGSKASRADVADFMLAQLSSNEYLGQAPMVSY